ncbi:MAG: GlxA family transcriptional regulator [Gammaproteobacteria bacterium]
MGAPSPSTNPRQRTIAMLAFPECELIDVSGPISVFSFANKAAVLVGQATEPVYRLIVAASIKGPVRTSSGICLCADQAIDEPITGIDTLMVAGGAAIDHAIHDEKIQHWLIRMYPQVRRLASICTGAFILAESGLLNNRKATTHWLYCQAFADQYRNVKVEPEKIFVRDGNVYTSGGVTAGIDLALSLVEEDWGWDIASMVARSMLIFMRRPGGQSQFSSYIFNEAKTRHDFRELQAYVVANPNADLSVEKLADRMAMSPRNFSRLFCREIDMPPAKFVEKVRIEAARNMVLQTDMPLESIAANCGFNNTEQMRRAFYRTLNVTPHEYRSTFK